MSSSRQPPKRGGSFTILGSIAGAVAALALFVTNLGTLRDAWCGNVGTFCVQPLEWVQSEEVHLISGEAPSHVNSDKCGTHTALVCVKPTASGRKLVVETAKFQTKERSAGVYLDGNGGIPPNPDPVNTNNIGWFLEATRQSSDEICATVFARTSACETKVEIRGQLIARQQ